MNQKQFLEKYRTVIEENLHDLCKHHVVGGGQSMFTNPYRINIHSVVPSDGGFLVRFQLSLGSVGFAFWVPIEDSSPVRYEADLLQEEFRAFRNSFIVTNYPVIKIP